MRCTLAVLASVLIACAASTASAQTYALTTSWNAAGDGGIAVDAAGNVYVAAGTQVSNFDPSGTPIGGWTTSWVVQRVAIGADGSVYLLAANRDILEFNASGTLVNTWPGLAELDRGFSVDADRNLYVFVFVEGWNIRRISPTGELQNLFGSFEIPQAIAVGPDGSVYDRRRAQSLRGGTVRAGQRHAPRRVGRRVRAARRRHS